MSKLSRNAATRAFASALSPAKNTSRGLPSARTPRKIGAIAPWNYPQVLAMMKIAPALPAGCTVVLKPSPETALDPYVMGDAAQEAGLPPGVLNIVLADRGRRDRLPPGRRQGRVHRVDRTGRIIGAECGRLIRRMTLELPRVQVHLRQRQPAQGLIRGVSGDWGGGAFRPAPRSPALRRI
jgi:acyl-CoA reductase-like NAD-dependent aldehyde dehydrogenase